MGRKKLEKPNCKNCGNKVKVMRNVCCSPKCAGEYKRTRYLINCEYCKDKFYIEPNRAGRKRFCSENCRRSGIFTDEVREKMSKAKKGKPRISMRGNKCHFWKGGVTPINKKIRMSLAYRMWREKVYKRDDFTCQICFIKGGELNADHIKSFSMYASLRLELSNGRTLCVACHKKTDNYGKNRSL